MISSRTHRRDSRLAWLCLTPSALLLACVFIYPILSTALDSLSHVSPLTGRSGGLTLDNWRHVLADSGFTQGALPRTGLWVVAVVGLTVLLSLPAALLLNDRFRGRRLARIVLLLPWAVPVPVSAILWKFIMDGQLGTLNAALSRLGVHGPVWLAEAKTSFPVAIWVATWVSIPFTTITLLAGLQSIGAEVREAAALDGATGWAQFRAITLPLLRPVLNIVVILNAIYVFNSFPILWILTQGGPAGSTDTVITSLYKTAFRFSQPGPAQAMGVIAFVVLLSFSAIYLRLVERRQA